jgi:XTP/dITP diphosphohydrolase
MNSVTYITSNKEKIETAKRKLLTSGICVESKSLDLVEIQSNSIKEIAEHKAKQAFSILNKPLFVTDHGWSIPALQGFPGPYMKYMNEWLTSQDFLSLMSTHNDKSILKEEVLCYVDSNGIKIYSMSIAGRFLDTPQGEGLPMTRVVSLLSSGKTIAECISEGVDSYSENTLWQEFAEMLKSR